MKVTDYIIIILVMFIFSSSQCFSNEKIKDETNAKIARIKAKGRTGGHQRSQSGTPSDSDKCGSIEIGNAVNQRGSQGTKEITVVVTGDVINANNDCK